MKLDLVSGQQRDHQQQPQTPRLEASDASQSEQEQPAKASATSYLFEQSLGRAARRVESRLSCAKSTNSNNRSSTNDQIMSSLASGRTNVHSSDKSCESTSLDNSIDALKLRPPTNGNRMHQQLNEMIHSNGTLGAAISGQMSNQTCKSHQQQPQQEAANQIPHQLTNSLSSSGSSRISSLLFSNKCSAPRVSRRLIAQTSTLLSGNFATLNLALGLLCVVALASGGGHSLAPEVAASDSAAPISVQPALEQRSDSRPQPSGGVSASLVDQPKSVVASLSSAVATAAAAAAVAAAQSSLGPSDARGRSQHQHSAHHHQSRSSVGNQLNGLAIKMIADAIPEVPYNILHNMKKLDHAAPFYNVANKFNGVGATKELSSSSSGASLLLNALTSLGSASAGPTPASAAVDHLAALFKSPFWKRISEGYGEFASEFRGLFRAQQPTPMKASAGSSAGKLIRDISVPALLMLAASSMSSDWRPSKARRKQSSGVLSGGAGSGLGVDTLAPAASSQLAEYSHYPSFVGQTNQAAVGAGQMVAGLGAFEQMQRAPQQNHIHLAPLANGQRLGASRPLTEPINRRSGEQRQVLAPVAFGSLTSTAGGKLMSKIMNANGERARHLSGDIGDRDAGQREFAAPVDRSDQVELLPLGDKHKYSLVASAEEEPPTATKSGARLTGGGARILSAMGQALSSVLATGGRALESGYLLEHKTTINQHSSGQTAAQTSRRQSSAGASNSSAGEQRDLSQLVPASWKEVVKRTVNSVQQQANSQWKSIEGQLTNWVQDKLKSFPAPTSGGQSAQGSMSSVAVSAPASGSPQSAPVSSLIASMSSSAMNMLGLGGGGAKSAASHQESSGGATTTNNNNNNKSQDSAPTRSGQGAGTQVAVAAINGAKAAFVGVADMIVNTLTNNRNATSLAPLAKPASAPLPAPPTASLSYGPTQQSAGASSGPMLAEVATPTGV